MTSSKEKKTTFYNIISHLGRRPRGAHYFHRVCFECICFYYDFVAHMAICVWVKINKYPKTRRTRIDDETGTHDADALTSYYNCC